MSDFSEFKDVFIGEAEDLLGKTEQALVRLEQDLANAELLHEIFRHVHTLKGNAATMGLQKMTELAHAAEDCLDPLAKGKSAATRPVFDALLASLDVLRKLLSEVREEKDLGVDIAPALAKLKASGQALQEAPRVGPPAEDPGQGARAAAIAAGAPPEAKPASVPVPPVAAQSPPPAQAGKDESPSARSTVRVGFKHLDNIMNLVEELTISKARLIQQTQTLRLGVLEDELKIFERLIQQLQQEALDTRTVPVGEIFEHYRRIVRDTAHTLGKQVEFSIEDQGISVDRLLLYNINEPLVHLLRNSIDHGIESPDVRAREGKPAEGKLTLRARRDQGYAVIEVTDDGKGMDPDRIRREAVSRGIMTEEESARMSDTDALYLVCHPGFSTADKVTEISGRGVGMDVVQRTIDSVNGRLEISSELGKGTRISLFLPLNLAIIQALLVRIAEETYAIPIADVLELVSLDSFKPKTVDKQPVISLRGEVVPLVDVRRAFGLPGQEQGMGDKGGYGVVIRVSRGKAAMYVDDVVDRREIVMKNLSGLLRHVKGVSNCTILGDGRVVLIIDVRGLV